MCSELFRIPWSWGGVPIFGFGVLLIVWIVASAVTLFGLVRRHGLSSETWSALPFMVLTGAAIVFLPSLFPEGFPVRGYGVMLLASICAGVAMAAYRGSKAGIHPELIVSLAFWLVVSGVVGARLFHVVEYWDDRFAGKNPGETLVEILKFFEGGLVIYGGFFGAALGFVAFVRKHGLPLLAMADLVAPSLAIGLALGRVGCFLNGCCYGGQTDWPWAVTFPQYSSRFEAAKPQAQRRHSPPYLDQAMRGEMYGFRLESASDGSAMVDPLAVPVRDRERVDSPVVVARVDSGSPAAAAGLKVGDIIVGINSTRVSSLSDAKELLFANFEAQRPLRFELSTGKSVHIAAVPIPVRSRPVHPTQLYSAIDAGLLGWLLWSFYPFRRRDGESLAMLLTVHPITRFLLEIIRTDEPAVFGTGMSISQNISIALLACGTALWWYLSKLPRGIAWPLVTVGPPSRGGQGAAKQVGPPSRSGQTWKESVE
jgi:phosphatidylglycerol:prolipoprotein diacylglycerol transferase